MDKLQKYEKRRDYWRDFGNSMTPSWLVFVISLLSVALSMDLNLEYFGKIASAFICYEFTMFLFSLLCEIIACIYSKKVKKLSEELVKQKQTEVHLNEDK